MSRKALKNPPLVEVILEVRWELTGIASSDTKIDPHYKLLPGKLSDALSEKYPYHEELPAASIPDEISPYVVKHRFRQAKDDWPLVQLGPGILTVNHTKRYTTFDEFRPLVVDAVDVLFRVYPERDRLRISSLMLRCIDAKEFDCNKHDVTAFLRDKMGIPLSLPDKLFKNTGVRKIPNNFIWHLSFPCERPEGSATLKFALGTSSGKPVLIWEQVVNSANSQVPPMPKGFAAWIDAAHAVTEAWFLSLIEGELEKEFDNG